MISGGGLGFLPIDAWNAFNEVNLVEIIWDVLHEFPRGAVTIVVRDTEDRSGHFFHIKEGVTPGDPLSMITYGIGFLPLIRDILDAPPRVTKPWYTDESGTGGNLGTSWNTYRTCRRGVHRGATSRNQPRVSFSWTRWTW